MRRPQGHTNSGVGLYRRTVELTLLFMLGAPLTSASLAQSSSQDEYTVRAAMVFNLTKFIDWPEWKVDQEHPAFVVCLLGSDPISSTLKSLLQNKLIKSKPIIVRELRSVDAAKECHILYVGSKEAKSLNRALADLENNAVLTISERANTESPGQAVGLPNNEEHVRIDVNLGVAQRSKLIVSSKLLHLATVSQ